MTEIPNQGELLDRKLGDEELARAAKQLRGQLSLYYKTPALDDIEARFESGGFKRWIVNKVDGDQQTIHINCGNGEVIDIWVARGPAGVNTVSYVKHDREVTELIDSEQAVRAIQGSLAGFTPS